MGINHASAPNRDMEIIPVQETNQPSTPNQVAAMTITDAAIRAKPHPSRRRVGSSSFVPDPTLRAIDPTICAIATQTRPTARAIEEMARGTGPGRAAVRGLTGRLGADLGAPNFRPLLLCEPALDVLERAVPGEDPRDFVDVRDAIHVRVPRILENPSSHTCPACHT